MNNNLMLLGLLAAGFLFLRRPTSNGARSIDPGFYPNQIYGVPGQMENPVTRPREVPQVMGYDDTGLDQWGVL